MSNFLLWLIAQNTTQSLAHQMQKDDPKLWNIAQFSLFGSDAFSAYWFLLPDTGSFLDHCFNSSGYCLCNPY